MTRPFTTPVRILILSFLLCAAGAGAQNIAINASGAAANASSMLDISSGTGNNRGLLIPRVTAAQKAAMNPLPAAAQGLVVYQTDGIEGFYYNTSTSTTPSWSYLTNSVSGWSTTGNTGTTAGTNFIGTTDAADWVIKTNNTERARVLSSGNFGIGTTVPAQLLDVQGGNGRINNAFIGDVGHGAGWGGISHSSMNTTTGYALIESSDGAYTLINKQNTGTGWIGFRVANADVAVITNAGNMGIGTTTPAYRLDLANGTFGFGSSNQRTETRNDAGLQGSAGAQSGFFETSAPSPASDWPTGASSWWHLIDVRHSNTANNYAMQFAGSFFDQNLYFRKTAGSATTAWSQVLTSSSTIGQSSTTSYTTSAVTLTTGGASFIYAGGFPVTVTVPANSTVIVTADIGVATNSASTSGFSVVDVALFVDGAIPTDGAYQRLCPSNNGGLTGQTAVFSMSQAFSSLSAGSHTFGVAGINVSSGGFAANATLGGNNTSVLQGEMTITIIKN